MPSPRFGAVLTAMVTPFDDDGALDLGAAADLARWLVDHGNDGLVIAGTTGEAPVLSDDEHASLVRAVREAVTVPVVVGVGTNDTAHTVALAKEAEAGGADCVLVVTPYYNRPSQAGLAAHFRAVAGAVAAPVMLYDIPIRSGRKIATDTMLDLARTVTNVVAVKDASSDIPGAARLAAEAPAGFEIYSGNSSETLPLLAVGAVGVVGVASHWTGPEHQELLRSWGKGDIEGARLANAKLIEHYAFETSDEAPNPLPAKAVMRALGLKVGQCRLPMGPAPDGLDARAEALVAALAASRQQA